VIKSLFIVIAIKIGFDIIYDFWGIRDHTNWEITYHFINHLFVTAIMMFCVFYIQNIGSHPVVKEKKWILKHIDFWTLICGVTGSLFFMYGFIELQYLGLSYERYKEGIHQGDFALPQFLYTAMSFVWYGMWLFYLKWKERKFGYENCD